MMILRSPPTDIPATPMSQPLITSPRPSLNANGLPLVFLSKTLPFFNLPMYLMPTLAPLLACGPLPIVRSSITMPPSKTLLFGLCLSCSFLLLGFVGPSSKSFLNSTFFTFLAFFSSSFSSCFLFFSFLLFLGSGLTSSFCSSSSCSSSPSLSSSSSSWTSSIRTSSSSSSSKSSMSSPIISSSSGVKS
ncbi:hypothetical protein AWRI1631_130620 [Saccharomyces cerevisiae AWRI1631]|uniref:Uncharacterized protein n=1 Tax=Saccharomyces cerevisiae (strain AWRI1631) TaxID=545124 RepID=B5VP57_YEAS6|nr:hypothetical protein AWRI1631_130620 [Saccharomyces cerevisiae AWRI1631]